jgi:hypothetical protein
MEDVFPRVPDTDTQELYSMAVHLVNLTNPMMMKGSFRELLPIKVDVNIKIPDNEKVTGVQLLMAGTKPAFENKNGIESSTDFGSRNHCS